MCFEACKKGVTESLGEASGNIEGKSSCPVGSDFGQDSVSRIALPEIKGRRAVLVRPNNNNERLSGRRRRSKSIYTLRVGWSCAKKAWVPAGVLDIAVWVPILSRSSC